MGWLTMFKYIGTFLIVLSLTACGPSAEVKQWVHQQENPTSYPVPDPVEAVSEEQFKAIIYEAYQLGARAGFDYCQQHKGANL